MKKSTIGLISTLYICLPLSVIRLIGNIKTVFTTSHKVCPIFLPILPSPFHISINFCILKIFIKKSIKEGIIVSLKNCVIGSKKLAIFSPPIQPTIAPIPAPTKPPTKVPTTGKILPIPAPINAHFPIPLKAPFSPLSVPPMTPPIIPLIPETPHSPLLKKPLIPSTTAQIIPPISPAIGKAFPIVAPIVATLPPIPPLPSKPPIKSDIKLVSPSVFLSIPSKSLNKLPKYRNPVPITPILATSDSLGAFLPFLLENNPCAFPKTFFIPSITLPPKNSSKGANITFNPPNIAPLID